MKSIEIKANIRKEIGKKQTRELRKKDLVPCVMYGGEEVVHFAVPENDLRHIIYTNQVYVVDLDVDGKKYKAILKEAQYHPVSDRPLHLDFIEVSDDKSATISLPVKITGKSEGIIAGGKLRQRRRYIKVKGLVKDMPEELVIDITNLNIGDHVKIEDLKFENLELLDPPRAMVLGVAASRLSKGMEEGEDEGAAAEEAEGAEATEEGAEAPSESAE